MCLDAEDLKAQAGWDGAQGESRKMLLSEISSRWIHVNQTRVEYGLTILQDSCRQK